MVKTKPQWGQEKNGCHLHLRDWTVILIKSSQQIVLNDQTNKKPALVKIMVWHPRSTGIVIQANFLRFKIWQSWHHDGSQLSTLFSAQWRQLRLAGSTITKSFHHANFVLTSSTADCPNNHWCPLPVRTKLASWQLNFLGCFQPGGGS